jgi:vacuolar-type H+-ATPase subunit E/Vma4
MKARAEDDNAKLFEIEKKNITRDMRKREEEIREAHLLAIVRMRESLVDEAWSAAKARFLSLPSRKKEYAAFMDRLLAMARKDGDFEVYMRRADAALWKGAKAADISGGIVMRSRDLKVERDYSLTGIAGHSEQGAKAKISEVLFG